MSEAGWKIRFDAIPVGSRLDVWDLSSQMCGTLDAVEEDGILLSWFVIEWQMANGKPIEQMVRKTMFIPFDEIRSYAWVK